MTIIAGNPDGRATSPALMTYSPPAETARDIIRSLEPRKELEPSRISLKGLFAAQAS